MNNNNSTSTRFPQLQQSPYPPPRPPSSINATTSSNSPPPTTTKKCTFPSGFRFCPRDKELIVEYLAKKIKNLPLPCHCVINDVMVYHYPPYHLAAMYEEVGNKEWYFFSPRDKKYKRGSRPDRAAGDGYWKASGPGKPVRDDEGVVVGFKRSLVFYKGKQGSAHRDIKTNWIMHEYFMDKSHIELMGNGDNRDIMRFDWALCRIFSRDYKKGSDLHTVICPQPISLGPPHQDSKVVNDSGRGQMARVLDYGREGITTMEEMQPNDVMRSKEYTSVSATSVSNGLPAIRPQSMASVSQQQNSKVVSDTCGGYWQRPIHVMGYGEEGYATKEEIENNYVMRAPEYATVSASGDIYDIHTGICSHQPLATAPLQQHFEVVSTSAGSRQPGQQPNAFDYNVHKGRNVIT